jgi:hypothetical protein
LDKQFVQLGDRQSEVLLRVPLDKRSELQELEVAGDRPGGVEVCIEPQFPDLRPDLSDAAQNLVTPGPELDQQSLIDAE